MIKTITINVFRTITAVLLAAHLSLFSMQAYALEAKGFPVGPFKVYPALGVVEVYDDNIFLAQNNEKDSWVTVISPHILAKTQYRASTYSILYHADIARFHSSSNDNFEDQQLLAKADMVLSSRVRLDLQAEFLDGHDGRGTTDRVVANGPDEWHSWGIGGVFGYGAEKARGQFELEASYVDKEYDNNRAITRGADHAIGEVGGTFYWRVRPKTQLVFEARYADIDYDLSSANLDSDEQRYYIGVKWDATFKTTGTAKIGYMMKDFDSAARKNFDGASWEIGVQWRPRSYAVVDISTSKGFTESTGVGDVTVVQDFDVSWKNQWGHRLSTTASLRLANLDYQNSPREDDFQKYELRADYALRRWLDMGAGYFYEDRDSNTAGNDYNRNNFRVSLDASF